MSGAVLVTGATGTVGSSVVEELVRAGEPVRAATTNPQRYAVDGADPVRFDCTDPATLAPAFEGVDRLFLLRPPAISDVKTYLRPVLELATRRSVRQVVFLSLMGVNPAMPHWRVERDIEASRLPHTILRAAFFAQNLATAYRTDIREHDRLRLPAGQGRTSFVDTRDVGAVGALALRDPAAHAGAKHVLTGPAALGYADVASLLSAQLGRPIRYQPIGLLTYRRELLAAGTASDYVNVQLLINVIAGLGLAGRVTDTIPRLLGRPATPLATYLADHADTWRR